MNLGVKERELGRNRDNKYNYLAMRDLLDLQVALQEPGVVIKYFVVILWVYIIIFGGATPIEFGILILVLQSRLLGLGNLI